MQLARYPRGREHARALDAAPVRRPRDADPPPAPRRARAEYGREGEGDGGRQTAGSDWVGWRVTDELGKTVGRVEGTIQPDWLIIRHGRSRHLLAPATDAIVGGEAVFLPFPIEAIEAAPEIAPGGAIPASALIAAAEHYGGAVPSPAAP